MSFCKCLYLFENLMIPGSNKLSILTWSLSKNKIKLNSSSHLYFCDFIWGFKQVCKLMPKNPAYKTATLCPIQGHPWPYEFATGAVLRFKMQGVFHHIISLNRYFFSWHIERVLSTYIMLEIWWLTFKLKLKLKSN